MEFAKKKNFIPSIAGTTTDARKFVSVVIPARNAATTLPDALDSLLAQTFSDWEAIVVNDGSTDETASIAARYAARDPRILVVSLPHRGASAARNTGAALTRFNWLLFLDADDWLAPRHLEKLTTALVSEPELDAVHCGWARVTGDGQIYDESCCDETGDLFARLTHRYAFAIHACMVRRSLVEAIGGFDTTLSTCEDWDFWQRIARMGAVFGRVDEVLSYYRMRPDSASLHGSEMLSHGLRVICQGHFPDLRISTPGPARLDGLPVGQQLSGKKLLWACWCAGLAIGRDQDPLPLLEALKDERDPALEPRAVAHNIFYAVPLPRCRPLSDWNLLWQRQEERINRFLETLEAHSTTRGLARGTHILLERLILEHVTSVRPLTIGTTHAIRIEVTEPIMDILPPPSAERLHCLVELEKQPIGTLELPVCDGRVLGDVLRDAIAAQIA